MTERIDRAFRVIAAAPDAIYRAFIDPDRQARWLPPTGMHGRFERFEPKPGGRYRMVLTYDDGGAAHGGKSGADADIVEGRFLVLEPARRIVQTAVFESDDPAFAGTMTMTWTLNAVKGGTEVTIAASDVPTGISPADHREGMAATLANLAAFIE